LAARNQPIEYAMKIAMAASGGRAVN